MNTRMYWLGKSIADLPAKCAEQLTEKFDVKEYFEDISILSEPDVNYCVLFLAANETRHLTVLNKLCYNLRKRLFVLLESPLLKPLPKPHDYMEISLLSKSFFPIWLDHLKHQHSLLEEPLPEESVSEELRPNLISIPRQMITFSPPSAVSDELKAVIRYIDKNLHQEIREEDAANLCHYSRNYFSKYFRREMGVSFRDYLTSKRLSLAQQLLKEQPKLKIAYIAYQCGYQDVSYFSRIFKKKIGITPANYRRQV